MASTPNLRGTKLATGQASKEEAINGLFDLHDAAIAGRLQKTITTADVTLTATPAAPEAQNKFFDLTGTLTGNRSLIFPVNDDDPATGNPRAIYVKNGTSGAFTVTVKVTGQSGVAVTQGYTAILLHNGTDFVKLLEVASATGVLSPGSLGGAWASYVPTWTNLSLGNGTVTAKYIQIGKTIIGKVILVFGSTTSVSGVITFSLPVTAAADAGSFASLIGNCRFMDASPTAGYLGMIYQASTTTGGTLAQNSSGTYVTQDLTSSAVPFTWTTSDELHAWFVYEAA